MANGDTKDFLVVLVEPVNEVISNATIDGDPTSKTPRGSVGAKLDAIPLAVKIFKEKGTRDTRLFMAKEREQPSQRVRNLSLPNALVRSRGLRV